MMDIQQVLSLRGPNIWARRPVIDATLNTGCSQPADPHLIAAFDRGLCEHLRRFSAVPIEAPSQGQLYSPEPGRYLAEAMSLATLILHATVRGPLAVRLIEPMLEPGVFKLVTEFEEERLARSCMDTARRLCIAVAESKSFNVEREVNELRALAADVCLGRNTAPLAAAARARGIPVRRLDEESLLQLGHGVRQHRVQTAITDRSGSIATAVSIDKELTKRLLREVGVPVPEGRLVRDADDAWAAAEEVGLPVVVKPCGGDYGHGVSLNLKSRDEVSSAYATARNYGEEVIVERFHPGVLHRLFVVGDEVVAALRREPAKVTGDGRRTVRELIDELNLDPRRVYDFVKLRIEEETLDVLTEQGLTPESIIPAGQTVLVRRYSHTWPGGTNIDVTDRLHPQVALRAVDATKVVGLDIAGLDLIAEDLSRPLEEQRGAVLEVNSGAAMILHLAPLCDRPRPVPEKILSSLFPEGTDGCIPTVVVSGSGNLSHTTRLLARMMRGTWDAVARAGTEGAFVNDLRIRAGDSANWAGAQAVLLHPRVAAAVLETPLTQILAEGLPVDRCHVAILLDSSDERWNSGDKDVSARAARAALESVRPTGTVILEATNAVALSQRDRCAGQVIVVSESPPLRSESGRRTVFLRDGRIVAAWDGRETDLLEVSAVLSHPANAGITPRDILSAIAAARALSVSVDEIVHRLK